MISSELTPLTVRSITVAPIAVTPGEPAGIGPDLCLQYWQKPPPGSPPLVFICDPEMLRQRALLLDIAVEIREYQPIAGLSQFSSEVMTVLPIAMARMVAPAVADTANAQYLLDTLRRAVVGCSRGEFSAMVTGPLNKAVINDAGISFSGHTEFLQKITGVPRVVMMLATEGLRVALATTHVSLAKVPALITRDRLIQVLDILIADLKKYFGTNNPRILVAGLNPHAGENGHMGREEIDVINPVIKFYQDKGVDLVGALPADTLFTPHHLEGADAVLAMYHDQGLPVLKYKGFGAAVNITLGLPIIRTSVDHGTAFDLAGTGRADIGSLITAINTAATMAAFAASGKPHDSPDNT